MEIQTQVLWPQHRGSFHFTVFHTRSVRPLEKDRIDVAVMKHHRVGWGGLNLVDRDASATAEGHSGVREERLTGRNLADALALQSHIGTRYKDETQVSGAQNRGSAALYGSVKAMPANLLQVASQTDSGSSIPFVPLSTRHGACSTDGSGLSRYLNFSSTRVFRFKSSVCASTPW